MSATTAVIPGADQPLGRDIATALVSNVDTLVLGGADWDHLERTAKALDDGDSQVLWLRTDVRDEFDVERLMETASRTGAAGIDLAIPCVRVDHGLDDAPFEGSYTGFDDEFRTIVRGVFSTVREAIPHLSADARIVVPVARDTSSRRTARMFEVTLEAFVRVLGPAVTGAVTAVDVGTIPLAQAAEATRQAETILAVLDGWRSDFDGRVVDETDL